MHNYSSMFASHNYKTRRCFYQMTVEIHVWPPSGVVCHSNGWYLVSSCHNFSWYIQASNNSSYGHGIALTVRRRYQTKWGLLSVLVSLDICIILLRLAFQLVYVCVYVGSWLQYAFTIGGTNELTKGMKTQKKSGFVVHMYEPIKCP